MKKYTLLLAWIVYLASILAGYGRLLFVLNSDAPNLFLRLIFSSGWKMSPVLGLCFLGLLFTWLLRIIRNGSRSGDKIVINLIGLSSVIALYVSSNLLDLETEYFVNYLYSSYGISVQSLAFLMQISLANLGVFIAFWVFESNQDKLKLPPKIDWRLSLALLFLGVFVWNSIGFLASLKRIFAYRDFNYFNQFGNMEVMENLKNVPEHGKIIIPPQSLEWPDIGNAPIARYFLFPRILISSAAVFDQKTAGSFGELYFPLLSKDNGAVWPVIDLQKRTLELNGGQKLKYLQISEFDPKKKIYLVIFEE